MKRKIININKDKCNGCGLCVSACHEGAIGMVDGKAQLMRDDYCDGLGDCLPVCPTNAITFEEREAAEYNEEAVKINMARRAAEKEKAENSKPEGAKPSPCGCPGTHAKKIVRADDAQHGGAKDGKQGGGDVAPLACGCPGTHSKKLERSQDTQSEGAHAYTAQAQQSRLSQWPVQIKLVPANAPYFDGANLLIAADCSAYAYADFHNKFIKNHITLIGCPKLDMVEYVEKLTDIIKNNNIKSVKIVRMEVPCCGGIESAAKMALQRSGKFLPWQVYTVSTDGRIVE